MANTVVVTQILNTVAVASPGPQGAAGQGVPTGGTAGQVIIKQSGDDYDTAWGDPVNVVESVNGETGVVVLTTDNIADSTDKRYVTDSHIALLTNTSGTNTGDQTSIVGITGSKSEFNTSCTDGVFVYSGDNVSSLTNDAGYVTSQGNAFSTISVSGQDDVVASSSTDTLTFVAGSNIVITTNAAGDSITIASSGGGGDVESVNGQTGVVVLDPTDLDVGAATAYQVFTVNAAGTAIVSDYAMNQSLQDIDSPTFASVKLTDTGGDHQLSFVVNEDLTVARTINIIVNDADRTIDLAGNFTLSGGSAEIVGGGSATITLPVHSTTFTTTGVTNVTFPTSGTLTVTSNHLGVFAATTSAQLASVISDETGSGPLVFGTAPTLTGNVSLGSGAVATDATSGFPYISTTTGTPTGTPSSISGYVPVVYDTTNDKAWIYNSSWKVLFDVKSMIPANLPTVTDDDYSIIVYATFPFTIDGIRQVSLASGSATLNVKINSTSVTGLGAISVTTTPQDVTATAANTVAVGDAIVFTFTSGSSPSDLTSVLEITRN